MEERSVRQQLLRGIAAVEEHVPLGSLNQLNLGGTAEFFCEAHDTVELASAVKAALDIKLPYRVIGQASRVLFADGGFPGLVIRNLSKSQGAAIDKSQMVVDAGLPLSSLVTMAASRGLGGISHLFGLPGSVGGALYANLGGIASNVRYLTMLMPASRLDKDATIVRYKREWLERKDGLTKLQHLSYTSDPLAPQPVILTALFQLTHVRGEEIRARIQRDGHEPPVGKVWGPIFLEKSDVPIDEFLRGIQAHKLKVGSLSVSRKHPNYLEAGRHLVQASEVKELVLLLQDRIEGQYAVRPEVALEFLGLW
jgi:UDP-N-acetylmuramate dehydrogenase